MHVHQQPALGGQLAQQPNAGSAIGHGALEVRNTADHVHALVQRAAQRVKRAGRPQQTILRKRHQLQIDVRRHAFFDVQHRVDRQQARVADIHMGADRQQPLGNGPVAIGKRALDQRLLRELRLQLAPERNAFEQCAALVDPGQAVAERRIHVKVRIDKGRRDQLATGVDHLVGWRHQAGADVGNQPVLNGNRHAGAAVGQGGVV